MCRNEVVVFFGLVSTQEQHVLYIQKLQVEQFVFDLFCGDTAAYHMRYHGYVVLGLYGRSDGNRARPATYALPFELSVGQFFINKFAMMRRYIDEKRIIPFQFIDGRKQATRSIALDRGEYFERKPPFVCIFVNDVDNPHLSCK